MDSSSWDMTNEFRWHAGLQQNDNGRAAATGEGWGQHIPALAQEEALLELAMAPVGAAVLSRCGQPQPFFLMLLPGYAEAKIWLLLHPTQPPSSTCSSLCSAGLFREDTSPPGEEKPNGSIAFLTKIAPFIDFFNHKLHC